MSKGDCDILFANQKLGQGFITFWFQKFLHNFLLPASVSVFIRIRPFNLLDLNFRTTKKYFRMYRRKCHRQCQKIIRSILMTINSINYSNNKANCDSISFLLIIVYCSSARTVKISFYFLWNELKLLISQL